MKSILRIAAAAGISFLAAATLASAASADVSGNENTSSQTGTNTSVSSQTSAAISGNATSADDGVATSGAAAVQSVFNGTQALNFASYIQGDFGAGVDVDDNTNESSQTATNGVENTQENAAASGIADASDGGTSTTGDAASILGNTQNQAQSLLAQIQSAFQAAAEEEAAP